VLRREALCSGGGKRVVRAITLVLAGFWELSWLFRKAAGETK
jgi:hypothetical protein